MHFTETRMVKSLFPQRFHDPPSHTNGLFTRQKGDTTIALLNEYMLLRQLAPAAVLGFYWFAIKIGTPRVFSTVFVLLSSLVLLFSFPKPFVARLWIAYCLIIYGYGYHVSGDHVFAASYAILSAHFGGWLYEVPFWHPLSMFYSFCYPWVINTQILSGVSCAWLLKKREIKPNKTMLYALLGYIAVSVFYILKPSPRFIMSVQLWWLPRLGTMFLLGSNLTGIIGENKK